MATESTVLLNTTISSKIGHAVGRFVFSSSFTLAHDSAVPQNAASVSDADRHGLFTAYLLKALNGDADFDGAHLIDIYKLATYTKKNVVALSTRLVQAHRTETLQEPVFYFAGNDFFALHSAGPQNPSQSAIH